MIVESLFFVVYFNWFWSMSLLTSSESVVAYTYNVGSSNVHLIMVLFCLGWSGNLCLILYLQKEHRMVEENRAEDNEATYTTQIEKKYCSRKGISSTYLCCFNDFSKVFQDGLDIIFQSLVIALQQSLFALRENSLSSHSAQERQYTALYLSI